MKSLERCFSSVLVTSNFVFLCNKIFYYIWQNKTLKKKNLGDIIDVEMQQYELGSYKYGSYFQQSKPSLVFFRN